MSFCEKCGTPRIDSNDKFCSSCGEPFPQQDIKPFGDVVMCNGCNKPFSTMEGKRQVCPNCGYERGYKRTAKTTNNKLIGIIACAVALIVVIVGAVAIFGSGDGGNGIDSRIIGTWEGSDGFYSASFVFNKDGSAKVMGMGKTSDTFYYETKQNRTLTIYNRNSTDEMTMGYKIDGNKLYLYQDSKELVLIRK